MSDGADGDTPGPDNDEVNGNERDVELSTAGNVDVLRVLGKLDSLRVRVSAMPRQSCTYLF